MQIERPKRDLHMDDKVWTEGRCTGDEGGGTNRQKEKGTKSHMWSHRDYGVRISGKK